MEYIIEVNGQDYTLPKKNLKVVESLDKVLRVDDDKTLSITKKYQRLHEFVKEIVGEEEARQMFGTDILADIELSELTLTVRKIADAYEKPVRDYKEERTRAAFEGIPIEKMITMSKAVQNLTTLNNAPQGKC